MTTRGSLASLLIAACVPARPLATPLIENVPAAADARPMPAGTTRRFLPLATSGHLQVGVLQLRPGRLPSHLHRHADEIVYIIRGRARCRVGAEERPLGPGDLVVIPRTHVHSVEVLEELTALQIMSPGADPPTPAP
jgi:mannose-6-phosphate isomerase-like protein (cupin superfamily)